MAEIKTHLIKLRKDAGLSQYELAERLRKNRGWVSQIEQGIMDIKTTSIRQWAQVCTEVEPPIRLEVVVHQVLNCICGVPMYDTPPGSGLFPICPCGAWK